MAGGNISSEKIDLLIYGPSKPIVDNGFSDQFVLHRFETMPDLERLPPAIAESETFFSFSMTTPGTVNFIDYMTSQTGRTALIGLYEFHIEDEAPLFGEGRGLDSLDALQLADARAPRDRADGSSIGRRTPAAPDRSPRFGSPRPAAAESGPGWHRRSGLQGRRRRRGAGRNSESTMAAARHPHEALSAVRPRARTAARRRVGSE